MTICNRNTAELAVLKLGTLELIEYQRVLHLSQPVWAMLLIKERNGTLRLRTLLDTL